MVILANYHGANHACRKVEILEEKDKLNDKIQQYETIFNNISEIVIVVRDNGEVVFANSAAEMILNAQPRRVPPEDWPQTFGLYLDDARTYFPVKNLPLLRALQGLEDATEEMILNPPNSENARWVAMSAYPLRDHKGEVEGVIIMLRDISYSKKLELSREKHARQAELLYSISRAIAEAGDDLTQILNSVVMNTANNIGDGCVLALLNVRKDKLKIAAVFHPEANIRSLLREYTSTMDYDLKAGLMGGIVSSGEPLLIPSISPEQMAAISQPEFARYIMDVGAHSLLVVPIKNQERILGTLSVSRDQGGRPYTSEDQTILLEIAHRTGLAIEHSVLVNSLREEIAERQFAERALSESEIRFKTIFETTSLGVKILDPSGIMLESNRAFQEFTGYARDQVIGKHFTNFLHPGDKSKSKYYFEKLASGEMSAFRLEHRLIRADGSTVWVNTSFSSVIQDSDPASPAYVFGIVENITERKHLELEMREMKTRLQENIERERLRLAQDLHDGPMQVLYSTIFQIESLRGQEALHQNEALAGLRQDIQKVIDDLRATAHELRPPTLADFGLEKAIRSHVEKLNELHPELEFKLYLSPDQKNLPENVRLALFRIYQTSVSNILRHANASRVEIRFTYDVEEARLEIKDDGSGFIVPPGWIQFTRDEHYGLAGAAERAESLGGTLAVESAPGEGTMISAVIPCLESD